MRKKLGYIPIDPDEDLEALKSETEIIKLDGQWFKLADVWVPGVANVQSNENINGGNNKKVYQPSSDGKVCDNCGKRRDEHMFFKFCGGTKFSKTGHDIK